MSERERLLSFSYRGLFQSAEIHFFKQTQNLGYKVICEADIKLPVMKKNYEVATLFQDNFFSWIEHTPVFEKNTPQNTVRRDEIQGKGLDPIGFFMQIDQVGWTEPEVHLLIGKRVVVLEVENRGSALEVRRPDKDQKLIIHKDKKGITKIEIPLPFIGSISLKRETA